MKKIFLCSSKLNNYENKIISELKKQGYEVEFFDYHSFYEKNKKIKNIFLRVWNNLFYKNFSDKHFKREKVAKKFNEEFLKNIEKIDIFLKIGQIRLEKSTLKIVREKSKIMISHHWDSIGKVVTEDILKIEKKYFDKISSYDKKDCQKYKLKYLPNFYLNTSYNHNQRSITSIYTIMSDETKLMTLEKIARKLQEFKIKYDITLVTYKELKSDLIKIQSNFITVDEMQNKIQENSVLLELKRSDNNGCTFRSIDCIGMKKKLITNNKDIVNEDFYSPNNILIIDENNIEIPKEFIYSPYEDLPKEIYEKYSLENWVKQLLDLK